MNIIVGCSTYIRIVLWTFPWYYIIDSIAFDSSASLWQIPLSWSSRCLVVIINSILLLFIHFNSNSTCLLFDSVSILIIDLNSYLLHIWSGQLCIINETTTVYPDWFFKYIFKTQIEQDLLLILLISNLFVPNPIIYLYFHFAPSWHVIVFICPYYILLF